VIVGCVFAAFLAVIGSTAVAQRSAARAGAVFEATHLPPLLTIQGEPIRLAYDVQCAAEGIEDPERRCDVSGTLFVRRGTRGPYRPIRLEPSVTDGLRQLSVAVPSDVAAGLDGFEYFAELRADGVGEPLSVPAGGADAPHRSLPLRRPVSIDVGRHSFAATRRGARAASARWGDGPNDVGLEPGRNLPPAGAASFDVGPDGSIVLLDEAHGRALRWQPGAAAPARVPLAVSGRLADVAVDDSGSIHVLESIAPLGGTPVVRRFDPSGRELGVVETAERTSSQVRIGPRGPVVLQHPSHQWMDVGRGGSPATPHDQRRSGTTGRPLRAGGEVVVLRRGSEILAAVVANGGVQRSWRVTSDTALGEVQLAEPMGQRLVLVARVYDDVSAEFVVLVVDRSGLVRRFAVPVDEWAESAPFGRFRLDGSRLYRLGSDPTGAFVDTYDLEPR
jgi:hypothetical protein